ncbi:TlpA disulfide reductase family protein [Pedobacter aquatilis]|uniref:TlpA family protein disulfide reductase n=1 Tax=Pedobacter aquatilis TaxID=351343 RepID=UPI002930DA58|nr:TlpA disulfide reductase family protein [Pedobacter aquatilis]
MKFPFLIKRFPILMLLTLVAAFEANAQILFESAKKIGSAVSLNYTDIVETKFSFQDQSYADTLHSSLKQGKYLLKAEKTSYAFDGNKLVTLNFSDSTYTVKSESVSGQDTRTLFYWIKEIEKIRSSNLKTRQLPDTVIGKRQLTHIRVTERDTLVDKEKEYMICDYFIDKVNSLPIKIVRIFKGRGNDGTDFGLIEIHNYSDYKLNQKNFPDLGRIEIPAYFTLPKKSEPVKFLENGLMAPLLNASDLKGVKLDNEVLKGKLVLINFSLIGCPHCVGASQMLNRLQQKYKSANLRIINIYPIDEAKVVASFDLREKVTSPSYISDRSINKLYPINGYPSFYLIGTDGKIAQSYNGFYKNLEADLIEKIDDLLK